MCVCGLLELQAFLPNFIVLLKALFAKDSKWSDCAEAGGVVLDFRTLSPGLAVLSRDWANIAWVNHASWASGLLRLVDSSNQVCRRAAASFHNCALRFAPAAALAAADLFIAAVVGNVSMFFKDFRFKNVIHVRLHELVGGERDAPVFTPAEVEVEWIGDELCIWKGSKAEIPVAAPVPAPPAPAAAAGGAAPAADPGIVALPIADADAFAEESRAQWAIQLAQAVELFAVEQALGSL